MVHAATGEELASQEPDRPGAPASMTKMMLALVVMEAVKEGQLTMADPVPTSRLASKMGGSQVYLKEGESFSVEEMLAGLLIGSLLGLSFPAFVSAILLLLVFAIHLRWFPVISAGALDDPVERLEAELGVEDTCARH